MCDQFTTAGTDTADEDWTPDIIDPDEVQLPVSSDPPAAKRGRGRPKSERKPLPPKDHEVARRRNASMSQAEFARARNEGLREVKKKVGGLPAAAIEVLNYLIERTNRPKACCSIDPENGVTPGAAWVRHKVIAEAIGKSVSAVRAAIRELVRLGLLYCDSERLRDDGSQTSNLYIVLALVADEQIGIFPATPLSEEIRAANCPDAPLPLEKHPPAKGLAPVLSPLRISPTDPDSVAREGSTSSSVDEKEISEKPSDVQAALESYNRHAKAQGWTPCTRLTDARAKKLKRRLDEIGLQAFEQALGAVPRDAFLSGQVTGKDGRPPFRLDLDRLLQTEGRLGDVLAKLIDLAEQPEKIEPGPNGKPWGWWDTPEIKDLLRHREPAKWREGFERFPPNGRWPWWLFGPPPGDPECLVPPEIVAERGWDRLYKGKIKHDDHVTAEAAPATAAHKETTNLTDAQQRLFDDIVGLTGMRVTDEYKRVVRSHIASLNVDDECADLMISGLRKTGYRYPPTTANIEVAHTRAVEVRERSLAATNLIKLWSDYKPLATRARDHLRDTCSRWDDIEWGKNVSGYVFKGERIRSESAGDMVPVIEDLCGADSTEAEKMRIAAKLINSLGSHPKSLNELQQLAASLVVRWPTQNAGIEYGRKAAHPGGRFKPKEFSHRSSATTHPLPRPDDVELDIETALRMMDGGHQLTGRVMVADDEEIDTETLKRIMMGGKP